MTSQPTNEPKDRLIQTRVPSRLESTLKEEARKQGTTVSHLVREVLEDAFDLVDNVVADVDQIVSDAVALGQEVARGARRVADSARGLRDEAADSSAPSAEAVEAWNEVVLNRDQRCTRCGAALARGQVAWAALGPAAPVWRCRACLDAD